jgi:F420-dependent hydroxymycolic acid dehydrogenase
VAAGETTRSAWSDWEEAVTLIRRLWTGEWVSARGRYYPMEQARLYDVPSPSVPLYVAASGAKSMSLAGKIGDGLITFTGQASQPELRPAFEQGAGVVGKNPASMPTLAEVGAGQVRAVFASCTRFA